MKQTLCIAILALSWASLGQSQTPGLVAAYSFNEGTGPRISDLSGQNITGRIVGATWTTAGKYGNALSFNGSTSYVDLGNPAALQLTGSMTWSAWIKAAANPADDGQIVSKSNSASGWQLKSSPDTGPHTFGVAISAKGNISVQRYSTTVRSLNTWYHVAGVYNASAQTLDIYVNGVLDNGVLSGTVPASQLNSSVNVNIGRRSGGYYFNGVIDEVRMYNRALSQAEIQSDMNTPLGSAIITDTQAPTAPSTLTAAAASSSQINLSWGAATDNVGVTGYRLERCQGNGCSTFVQIAAPTGSTYSDTSLTAGTSYSYRVRATDAASNLGLYSTAASATTTAAPDTQAPTAPGTLTTSVISGTQINLSWGAATDNVGVTGYRLERCQGSGCSAFVQIATPTGTTYSNAGLTAGTSYSYRVRATDAASNVGPYSTAASATTTAAPDTQAPTAPGTLTTSVISGTQINLSWGAATDNVGVTGYRVERCQGAGCNTFVQIAAPTGTTYSNTGLTAGTSYSYRVRATDAGSNLGLYSNAASATTTAAPDTQAPTAPGTLTTSVISGTQINLNWGAATDNVGVTGYRVERCQGAGCNTFVQIATPTGTTYSDTSLTAGTSYSYRVRATDAASNVGPYSTAASATTTAAPDTQAPTAPGTLTTSVISGTQINLNWGAATDNVGVTGYRLERCQGSGCSAFVQIATPTGTTYSDTSLTAGTSYSYRVRATDAGSNLGLYSNAASATTTAAPDTQAPTAPGTLTTSVISGTQINLNWGAATDNVGVTGYRVERCQGAGCNTFVQIATPTGTTYSDTSLTAGTSYSYRVRATDAASNVGPYSTAASATTTAAPDTQAPTAPGTLTTSVISGTQINLSWGAATDNISITGCRLERCQGAGCSNFIQIATPTTTTYGDTGLIAGTIYSYRVRATDAAMNLGPYSNIATATTFSTITGLVSAYSFDEGAASTALDASSNGNTGAINGAAWTTSGKYGSALAFNGTSSYVDLGNPVSLQLADSMTVSAWINAAATPADDGQIVAKSDDSSGWQLKTTPDTGSHTFGIAISNGTGSHVQRYSKTVRSLNTWYHVAGVYNAAAQTLDIYVNGVLDNGVLSGTIPSSQLNSVVNVNIGRRTGGYLFNGTIDEVRVYNRPLTQTEIQSDMSAPVGSANPPTTYSISGTVSGSAAQLTLSGAASGSTNTDSSGNYSFSGLPNGLYNITPMQSGYAFTPSTAAISINGTSQAGVNFTATTAGSHSVTVSWTASTSTSISGYNIYRSSAPGGSYTMLNTLPVTTTSYLDSSVASGQTYFYVATTVQSTNESTYSNQATGAVPAP